MPRGVPSGQSAVSLCASGLVYFCGIWVSQSVAESVWDLRAEVAYRTEQDILRRLNMRRFDCSLIVLLVGGITSQATLAEEAGA